MAVAQPAHWVDGRRDDGLGSDAESVGVKLLAELRGVKRVAAARFEVNQHRLRDRTRPEVCTALAVVGVVQVRRHVGHRLTRDDQNEEAVGVKLTAVFAEQDVRASWKVTKVGGMAIRVDNRLVLVARSTCSREGHPAMYSDCQSLRFVCRWDLGHRTEGTRPRERGLR